MTGARIKDAPGLDEILARHGSPCAGADLDLFFPRDGEHTASAARRLAPTARDLCAACPIRSLCDGYATARRQHGLWGGRLHILTPGGKARQVDLLSDLPTRMPALVAGPRRRPRCTDPTHRVKIRSCGRKACLDCRARRERERRAEQAGSA